MWEQVRDLMIGACDLHIHSGPDVSPRQQDIMDVARDAARAGMRVLGIKDHNTITADRAALVHSTLGPQVLMMGSIVLNYAVGGFNPEAVEKALKMGGQPGVYAQHGCRQNHRKGPCHKGNTLASSFHQAERSERGPDGSGPVSGR